MEYSDNNLEVIRIGFDSKKKEVISYCKNILTSNNCKGLKFSAVGDSIGKLVDIVELLKILIPGLYQVNKLATVKYEENNNINANNKPKTRLFPKMEVKLILVMPTEITNGFQNKLSEEERKKLLNVYLKQKERERIEKERKEKERIEKERIEKEKLNKELNDKYNIIKDDLPIPFKLDKIKCEKLGKSNNDKCLICLEIYKIGNQVLYLPCLHLFHSTCIMRWLLKDSKCPICKKDYRDLEYNLIHEQFLEENNRSENSMPSLSSFYLFEGGNLRGRRGIGIGRGRGRGVYRVQRGMQRSVQRGLQRGLQRRVQRGMQREIQRGMQRGVQRGRGVNYYNNNYY